MDEDKNNGPSTNMENIVEQSTQINDIDFVLNLECRFQHLIAELQMYRAGVIEYRGDEKSARNGAEGASSVVAKIVAQQAERELEKAVATAMKSHQEYEVETKKCIILETRLQLVEAENEKLKSKIREMLTGNDFHKKREAELAAMLSAHESSKAHLERKMSRLQTTLDMLQENHQRLGIDLVRLETEMSSAWSHNERLIKNEEKQRKALDDNFVKLKNAYKEIARLTAITTGKEESKTKEEKVVDEKQERIFQLQRQLTEEMAVSQSLREALVTASEDHERLAMIISKIQASNDVSNLA